MTARPIGRMSRAARVLTFVAAALLAVMYLTPVWSVRLVAPQYPEGIGMYIRLNTIEGVKEHDIANINSLNHYIGMKTIEPDAIPELKYMPWIVAGLIASGIAVAALGRRRLLAGWLVAFALIGAAGLWDFWRWTYDYGHNLDLENAIIIVPGLSYQPPIFGTRQLANFTATSLPHIGGIAAGVTFLLAAVALFLSYRRRAPRGLQLAGAALAATACAANPQIVFGTDACVECRMLVTDQRFGAAVLTQTGKTLPFDSVDCLLEYLRAHPGTAVRSVWVVDAATRGALVPAEAALFVRDGALRPPMGNVVSFAAADAAGQAAPAGSVTLTWSELNAQVPTGAH